MQIRPIPSPKFTHQTASNAIVVVSSNPLRYKILCVGLCKPFTSHGVRYRPMRFELFVSKKWAWKRSDPWRVESHVCPISEPPVVLAGCVYMLMSTDEVLAFDTYTERYRLFALPPGTAALRRGMETYLHLIKVHRKLCVGCRTDVDSWTIWARVHDGLWTITNVLHNLDVYRNPMLEFDDPSTCIKVYGGFIVRFKGNQVFSIFPEPTSVYVYNSDFDEVDLAST